MATNYQNIWNSILTQEGTQNVDIIASINEDGINNYLEAHHTIDNRVYHKEIKKTFTSQGDSREFTVNLDITSPIQIQFPPFKNQSISNEFKNKDKWYKLDSEHNGPEISTVDDENKIQVYCNEINISLTWPKLHPVQGDPNPTWNFKLKTLKVFAEAFAILNNKDQDGYYLSLIPTIVKFDVTNPASLTKKLVTKTKELPNSEIKLLDECQEKFTDLFVIALNILATEQAPKLVRNIKIPVPSIANRPIFPALLNISQNCLTIGAGIDKAKTEKILQTAFDKEMLQLRASIASDIENAGGLLKVVSNNQTIPHDFEELKIKSKTEIKQAFVKTNEYIKALKLKTSNSSKKITTKIKSNNIIDDAYAIGINQYFFQNIVTSALPSPKHDCSGWLDLDVARGRVCYWVRFFDPNIIINQNNQDASLTGGLNIDIGGSIEACIRKFWDCSWSWACGSLALSLKGRPDITIELLKSNGVRLSAQMSGNVYFDINLPFPFNKIIDALTSVIGDAIIALINILLDVLSFVVIDPNITVPQQITKLKLRDFDSFYYIRPVISGNGDSKNKFIGYRGGLISEK